MRCIPRTAPLPSPPHASGCSCPLGTSNSCGSSTASSSSSSSPKSNRLAFPVALGLGGTPRAGLIGSVGNVSGRPSESGGFRARGRSSSSPRRIPPARSCFRMPQNARAIPASLAPAGPELKFDVPVQPSVSRTRPAAWIACCGAERRGVGADDGSSSPSSSSGSLPSSSESSDDSPLPGERAGVPERRLRRPPASLIPLGRAPNGECAW